MRILVIMPAWVGDMVMAQGLLISLTQKYYSHTLIIDIVIPNGAQTLVEHMPEVNQIYILPVKHGELGLFQRFKLGRDLKKNNYHQAFILPNSWKSALVPFFADIPKRTGYLGEMRWGLLNNILCLDKKKTPLIIDRFIALSEFNFDTQYSPATKIKPVLNINLNLLKTTFKKFKINADKNNIIILCPGAEFGSSKRWPEKYYAEIALYFIQKNYQIWLMGSQKDSAITQQINAQTNHQCIDFAGQTTLGEAVDLLSLGQLVITNDSGLMHIAAALDKKIIALYGSTSADFTPPLSTHAQILCLSPEQLTCRPCFKRECPLGHHRCMQDLKPELITACLKQCGF